MAETGLFILGGGMTGLAAGMASGLPVYEAAEVPGGICSSYYVAPGRKGRLHEAPADGDAYRFEIGGGHWIFGGDPIVLAFIEQLAPCRRYSRISGVWFADERRYVPYPIQNHLRSLGAETASQAVCEIVNAKPGGAVRTMEDWLYASFGKTLGDRFFAPFHALYTAGLHTQIAPQDGYKSPVDLNAVVQGAFKEVTAVGYNTTFLYPTDGLDHLARGMAQRCDVRYGKRAVKFEPRGQGGREVRFADGSSKAYARVLCTLPLNRAIEMAGIDLDEPADPYTSVLVLNVGGLKGAACPNDHWLYHPHTRSGFHRVGFYSNVDRSFLPRSSQQKQDRVSIYVEKAFVGGQKPGEAQIEQYARDVVQELTEWGFLAEAEAVDPTWIDVAYTWSRLGSTWKRAALRALEERGIYMVGRYGRWVFQGIADSIRDGMFAGASFRSR